MNYNWNVRTWVVQLLPSMLRKPVRVALHYALLVNVRQAYSSFLATKAAIDFDTQFDSETICIEEKLNKLFDPIEKRIHIITSDDMVEEHFIYGDDEDVVDDDETFIYGTGEVITEDKEVFITSSEEDELDFDFYVHFPTAGMIAANAPRINAEINKYRFAGFRYQLVVD